MNWLVDNSFFAALYTLQALANTLDWNPLYFFIAIDIFLGTYGAHGIEIIELKYPSLNVLEGIKITGDPNIPINKVTFRADLSKAIVLSKEEQETADCESLISTIELSSFQCFDFGSDQNSQSPVLQPFLVPRDARQRAKIEYEHCFYRFQGEGQVSPDNYSDPSFIPAHIIVFNCDTLGVLFLPLKSILTFSRVREDLSAVNFYECGANKCDS